MARPGLHIHPKFRRLVHVLHEPVPHVHGYLECMWLVAYENGEAMLGDSVDVELAAQYPGSSGKLTQSLTECGFLDALPDGKYAVHDLLDHAPDYVLKRLKREVERRAKGQARRRTFAPRQRALTAEWRQEADNGILNHDKAANSTYRPISADLGQPPAPAPAPESPPCPLNGKVESAADVVDHYQRMVDPEEGPEGGVEVVRLLFMEGFMARELMNAADGWAAKCQRDQKARKYRYAARNFYGSLRYFQSYLNHKDQQAAAREESIKATLAARAEDEAMMAEVRRQAQAKEAK